MKDEEITGEGGILLSGDSGIEDLLKRKLLERSSIFPSPPHFSVRILKMAKRRPWPFVSRIKSREALSPKEVEIVNDILRENNVDLIAQSARNRSRTLFFFGGILLYCGDLSEPIQLLVYSDAVTGGRLLDDIVRFIILTIKFSLMAPWSGDALLLHAAGIEHQGGAVLFAGESGSGKSTVSTLSGSRRIIHDDAIVLRPSNIRGQFSCTSVNAGCGESLAVKKVFFIKQAWHNKVLPMQEFEASREGLRHVLSLKPNFPRLDPFEKVVDMALEFFKHSPCYWLFFEKDSKFWHLIEGLDI